MPTVTGDPPLAHLGQADRTRLRNALHTASLDLLAPVYLNQADATFDDALATYMLCSVTTSDDAHHKYLPHRLACFFFLVQQLQLNILPEGISAEEKEERRRLWWNAYIVDKHSSFSFNMRPTLAESECRFIHRPCRDEIWENDKDFVDEETERPQGLGYEVLSLDWCGIFVALAAILSDLLEYHYLLQHPTFSTKTDLLSVLRSTLEHNMATFEKSVRELHVRKMRASRAGASAAISVMVWDAGQLRDLDTEFPSEPKLLLYAWHMLHCMYTLLYGKLDPVDIFQDTEWLLSNDFLLAAEHADKCTKVTVQILRLDPKLQCCYRMFGTYFLHSSFIFLVLARKLRQSADDYILNSCRTYLRTLEAFAATVNIKYQKTFARVLQDTISKCVEAQNQQQQLPDGSRIVAAPADDWLDPEILNYRWTAGHGGLWNGEMGRQSEAKNRRL
ncbi:hypothetical protein SCUCBS95973_003034 [Sporothrix curviconia]|uniref:Xylanolytic transcriptional activator regulatory domain-containing protein n=1 Tax=Sporothrix curviconia TaxID=1260050 RepID=A0ABP0BBX9_9PEZI